MPLCMCDIHGPPTNSTSYSHAYLHDGPVSSHDLAIIHHRFQAYPGISYKFDHVSTKIALDNTKHPREHPGPSPSCARHGGRPHLACAPPGLAITGAIGGLHLALAAPLDTSSDRSRSVGHRPPASPRGPQPREHRRAP